MSETHDRVKTLPQGRRGNAARPAAWCAAVILFGALAVLSHYRPYFGWDVTVTAWLQGIHAPGIHTLMVWISALGTGWLAVAVAACAGLTLFAVGLRREALVFFIGAGVGSLLNRAVKVIIARPRPPETLVNVAFAYQHESFPSGHTVFFVVVFGFLILVTCLFAKQRPLRVGLVTLFALLIVLVGISRIQLGAHWPSDVIGGYLLGGMCLAAMAATCRRRSS